MWYRKQARRGAWFAAVLLASFGVAAVPAWAFGGARDEAAPTLSAQTPGTQTPSGSATVPAPPLLPDTPGSDPSSDNDGAAPEDAEPEQPSTGGDGLRPQIDPNAPLPEIVYDLERLPPPVKIMREKIVAACKSGDIEQLRPLLGRGEDGTQVSLGEVDGDPVAFLRDLAGDENGQEILAILEMILDAGYVHLDAGKPEELYVWPYFFAIPLARLDGRQRVELFKIITAGDYEDMKTFGAYVFYRVGITPQGRWAFFVAGD